MPLRKRTASAVSARAQKRPCQQQSIVDDNFAAEQSDASPREARMPPCNSSSNSTVYTTFRHKKVQSRILATVLTTNELCIGRQSAEKLSTLPGFRAYHKEMMYERLFVKLDTGDVVSVEEHFDLLIQLILVVISKEGVATQAPHNKVIHVVFSATYLESYSITYHHILYTLTSSNTILLLSCINISYTVILYISYLSLY